MSSKFFTNTPNRNLFDKFKGILEDMRDVYAFHSVVGYFRSSGYFKLQPYLENLKDIKILVGINVDQMFADAQRKGLMFFGDNERTKHEFLKWFVEDIRDAKYSAEVEKGILQFTEDLISGRIEVRAHSSKTLHAKFYIFLPEKHTEHSDGSVIMGSSNLTAAGLGIKQSPNYELNVILKDYDDVAFAKDEFKKLWDESTNILPADIQRFKQKTHIGQSFTPYELYIKFLIEYFGKNIDYDPNTVGDLPKKFKKLSYQIDAVNEGFGMLLDHDGFFLADVVGLGKTVVAAMIAKRFLIANGLLNTKILVIYPPALETNWKNTFREFGISKHTKFITNGSLEKILKGDDLDYWAKEEYDLILVDEAHRYRNHTSQMFDNLQRICKAPRNGEGLIAGDKKKVILISATPLNNRPQDLYYQLLLFQDARKSTLPKTNLQNFFGPKIREYKEILDREEPDLNEIRSLYSEIRKEVIETITVRRTRKDLKSYPRYLDDMREQGIEFPEIAPPKKLEYELNDELNLTFYQTLSFLSNKMELNEFLANEFGEAIDLSKKLGYFRYQAIAYLTKEKQEEFGYEKAKLVSKSLAGIMKTLLVKRLESSFTAFKISLNNLLVSTRRMIEMFDRDSILIAPDLNINNLIEKGFEIEKIGEMIHDLTIENPRNNIFVCADFDDDFIDNLKKDERLLAELCEKWESISEDPKIDKFFEAFDNEFLREDKNPTGKLVIFTESKDTANYLHKKLEKKTGTKILNISAKNRNSLFYTIQENFDANYLGTPLDEYNILITTDVLAEGVNLHRANIIINYDTPWNATRLMQRIGRVNRIGSVAGVIYSYNFYPSDQGDSEINLYNNALVKLQGFHTALGEDAQVFSHEELVEQFELFSEGAESDIDKRLIYLKVIREFKDANPKEFRRIKNFPLKARTARSSKIAKKDGLKNSTAVFLKSPYKIEFYKSDDQNRVVSIPFVEAAEIFEAKASEPGFDLPQNHYEHVNKALQAFEQEFFSAETETVAAKDKSDAYSTQALKFLRDIKKMSKKGKFKTVCENLSEYVEKGTYTPIPKEIRKIRLSMDKRKISFGETENLVMRLAKKYDALGNEDENLENLASEISVGIEPEVVLSETFIE